MQTEIFQYVKGTGKYKNTNVALLMGSIHEDGVLITTAKANVVAGDVFTKERARHIVMERANKYELYDEVTIIPKSLIPAVVKFEERCERYFKNEQIINHFYPNQIIV